jgi:hypothetical protein
VSPYLCGFFSVSPYWIQASLGSPPPDAGNQRLASNHVGERGPSRSVSALYSNTPIPHFARHSVCFCSFLSTFRLLHFLNQKSQFKNQKFLFLPGAFTFLIRTVAPIIPRRWDKGCPTEFFVYARFQLNQGGTANLAVLPGNLPGRVAKLDF